jgi:signal transduction histidine kinase
VDALSGAAERSGSAPGASRGPTAKTRAKTAERYEAALRGLLAGEGEEALEAAYELGRWAIGEGIGVLDLAACHQEALAKALHESADKEKTSAAAGALLLEALSSFEIAHRGAREANEVLRHLNDRLEEETRRIANSVHSEASQMLASVHIALAELERALPESLRGSVAAFRLVLDGGESGLRRLSHELRPALLDDLGLVPAIRFHADGVAQRSGLTVLVSGSTQGRHAPQVETALYRVVQEALQNVVRHARATSATIFFRTDQEGLRCFIADDGIGFEPGAIARKADRGMGLMGIRDRVGSLGGTLEISWGGQGHGTVLAAFIPAPAAGGQ